MRDVDGRQFAAQPEELLNVTNRVGSTIGGAAEYVNAVAMTDDGGAYFAGSFKDFALFDGTRLDPQDPDYHDAFVGRLSPQGELMWVKPFGGRFDDTVLSIALADDGDLVLGGYFSRQADFGPDIQHLSDGRVDAYLARMSGDGDFRWVSRMGGDSITADERDSVNGVAIDGRGNIFAGGTFAGLSDFDPGKDRTEVRAAGETDAFVAKFNRDGGLTWVRTWGGFDRDGVGDIATNSGGDVFAASYFRDVADVDPGPATLLAVTQSSKDTPDDRATDLVLTRLDAQGELIYARQLQGTGYELIGSLTADEGNGAILAGSFFGTADFNPRAEQTLRTSRLLVERRRDALLGERSRSYDGFLWHLTASGSLHSVNTFGAGGDDFANAITPARVGYSYTVGRFGGFFSVGFDAVLGAGTQVIQSNQKDAAYVLRSEDAVL